jgi:hypothetical protein
MAQCHRGAAATCLPAGAHHRPGYVQAAGSTGCTQPAAPPGQRSRVRGTLADGMRSRGGVDWLLRESPRQTRSNGPGSAHRAIEIREKRRWGLSFYACPGDPAPQPTPGVMTRHGALDRHGSHTRSLFSACRRLTRLGDRCQPAASPALGNDGEPDTAVGAGHGAEGHGHFLAAPQVPVLGKRVGH